MKINEKTLLSFANSKPVDKEGYLMKRGEVNKAFQRRWFVLKGNLLFYFEKKGSDLLGMIILEGCVVELAESEFETNYCFNINFYGNRSYVLSADNQDILESWMKALTCCGFDYMRCLVQDLQQQLEELDRVSMTSTDSDNTVPPIPPRRQNPFNKTSGNEAMTTEQQMTFDDAVVLRKAPPPPNNRQAFPENFDTARFGYIRDDNEFNLMCEPARASRDDDFTFEQIHEELGKPILLAMNERRALKEKAEQPLIFL